MQTYTDLTDMDRGKGERKDLVIFGSASASTSRFVLAGLCQRRPCPLLSPSHLLACGVFAEVGIFLACRWQL
jgi:hypothetical protein